MLFLFAAGDEFDVMYILFLVFLEKEENSIIDECVYIYKH